MSGWIKCEYDDDGEIINPEFAIAPDDSWWWCASKNKCDVVMIKSGIWFRPDRIARAWHPDGVNNG